jgi:hypothetical protein
VTFQAHLAERDGYFAGASFVPGSCHGGQFPLSESQGLAAQPLSSSHRLKVS